jgi:hypothetical protein
MHNPAQNGSDWSFWSTPTGQNEQFLLATIEKSVTFRQAGTQLVEKLP